MKMVSDRIDVGNKHIREIVLILVVMEDGLRLIIGIVKPLLSVLILVVMEDGLRRTEGAGETAISVLILVVMEDGLRPNSVSLTT